MKLVVTGASGFIGRRLVGELARAGHTGFAVSRSPVADVPGGWAAISRDELLARRGGAPAIDAVVHLEVKHHAPSPLAADLQEFEAVNVGGTRAWLDWAEANGVPRFVQFSSIKAVVAARGGPTDESAAGPHPTAYGASKWRAELAVRDWQRRGEGRGAVIVRPAVVYGAGNQGNLGAMVAAIRRGRFFLVGRNDNVKSLVSVGNAVAAARSLLEGMRPGAIEVFNLSDPERITVRELDGRIRALLGKRGNSPTMPAFVARVLAGIGDGLTRVAGRPFPINSPRLEAMLETTDFSCAKLLATGFRHPEAALTGLVPE